MVVLAQMEVCTIRVPSRYESFGSKSSSDSLFCLAVLCLNKSSRPYGVDHEIETSVEVVCSSVWSLT